MINQLQDCLRTSLRALIAEGSLPAEADIEPKIERTRDNTHGDYATNLALGLAKIAGAKPRDLAAQIVAAMALPEFVGKCEIAGPGFINFHVSGNRWAEVLRGILQQAQSYGCNTVDQAQRIHLEYVSANPTGPLHVGHGRGAAYGASLARILEAVGHEVHREYYVNDMGRQMDILALSVWLRAAEQAGHPVQFPDNAYQGEYVRDIAQLAAGESPEQFATAPMIDAIFHEVADPEARLDTLIGQARKQLGADGFNRLLNCALRSVIEDIRADLAEFGVHYDLWFSERSLGESGRIQEEMDRLQAAGLTYEKEGATWFRATQFGDEKDRVLRRENGLTTYFASDVAYHLDKYERGYDRLINIWGADHHGYIPRVRSALQALHLDESRLQVQLVQFANLFRGGQKIQMSTRSGSFVTLRELRAEVGRDAARFYYVMRKADQHMDFDLDLAVSQSKDNPVYYVQYAHARVCRMLEKLAETDAKWDVEQAMEHLDLLTEDQEQEILGRLEAWPDVLSKAADQCAPHTVATYLRELAGQFHLYYNSHRVLVDEQPLRLARVGLSLGVRQVIANGLELLGVSAPERM